MDAEVEIKIACRMEVLRGIEQDIVTQLIRNPQQVVPDRVKAKPPTAMKITDLGPRARPRGTPGMCIYVRTTLGIPEQTVLPLCKKSDDLKRSKGGRPLGKTSD